MIIITIHKNDFKFEYRGNIEIAVHEEFLIISGKTRDIMSFEEYEWYSQTWDKFWLDDIKSITGVIE